MALSVVQNKVGNPIDNFDSTTLTFDSTPTAGNMIVVCINGWRSSGSGGFLLPAGTVTDNKGNTYNIAKASGLAGGTKQAIIYYAYNVTSSATFTVTINPTGTGNYASWSITEVAGTSRADPLDVTASKVEASATTAVVSGTTGTTTLADEIGFSVFCSNIDEASITVDAVTPAYTQIYEQKDAINHIPGEADYRIVTSTGAQSCSWTVTTACTYGAVIAMFKAVQTTTFPLTSVLDNFNRADSGSLGANWTDAVNGFSISSNQAVGESASWSISKYNTPATSTDVECYITLSTNSTGDKFGVISRWNNALGNGYGVTGHIVSGANYINIYRTDSYVDTNIAQVNTVFASGDSIGMSMVGSTLKTFYKPNGGSWELVSTKTDATYNNIGYFEMIQLGTTAKLDDFGGGNATVIKDMMGIGLIPFPR